MKQQKIILNKNEILRIKNLFVGHIHSLQNSLLIINQNLFFNDGKIYIKHKYPSYNYFEVTSKINNHSIIIYSKNNYAVQIMRNIPGALSIYENIDESGKISIYNDKLGGLSNV